MYLLFTSSARIKVMFSGQIKLIRKMYGLTMLSLEKDPLGPSNSLYFRDEIKVLV